MSDTKYRVQIIEHVNGSIEYEPQRFYPNAGYYCDGLWVKFKRQTASGLPYGEFRFKTKVEAEQFLDNVHQDSVKSVESSEYVPKDKA